MNTEQRSITAAVEWRDGVAWVTIRRDDLLAMEASCKEWERRARVATLWQLATGIIVFFVAVAIGASK